MYFRKARYSYIIKKKKKKRNLIKIPHLAYSTNMVCRAERDLILVELVTISVLVDYSSFQIVSFQQYVCELYTKNLCFDSLLYKHTKRIYGIRHALSLKRNKIIDITHGTIEPLWYKIWIIINFVFVKTIVVNVISTCTISFLTIYFSHELISSSHAAFPYIFTLKTRKCKLSK